MTLPRATFLMLTYDQQDLVADSVRAALAQDYPDLQIIVSDDRSGDGTLAAIGAVAATYAGPHDVLVRQPPANLGLVRHLYDAAALATGELIVVAAGDDLSYPHRVRALVRAWQASGADALCSNWDVIDGAGALIRRGRPGGRSDLRLSAFFPGRAVVQITGATAAYAAPVFRDVPCPATPIFAEDLYLTLMIHARGGRIVDLPEALVAYREHDASLTHRDWSGHDVRAWEQRAASQAARVARVLRAVDEQSGPDEGAIDREALREDRAYNEFRSGWIGSGFAARVAALARFRDPAHRRWLLPRLFGLRAFDRAKVLLGRVQALS